MPPAGQRKANPPRPNLSPLPNRRPPLKRKPPANRPPSPRRPSRPLNPLVPQAGALVLRTCWPWLERVARLNPATRRLRQQPRSSRRSQSKSPSRPLSQRLPKKSRLKRLPVVRKIRPAFWLPRASPPSLVLCLRKWLPPRRRRRRWPKRLPPSARRLAPLRRCQPSRLTPRSQSRPGRMKIAAQGRSHQISQEYRARRGDAKVPALHRADAGAATQRCRATDAAINPKIWRRELYAPHLEH